MEYEGVLWGIRGCWGVQGGVWGHEGVLGSVCVGKER